MSRTEDDRCIEKVLNGDRQAYSRIVDRYSDRVYSLALKICSCTEDAEEIAQDAFLKAYRSLKSFRHKSSFATWLYRITYNTAITSIRKKKSDTLKIEDFPADSVDFLKECETEEEAEREYRTALLNFAIQKLDTNDRAIISLFYYQESSVEEIAGILNFSCSNVKVRLYRARRKLEEIIKENAEIIKFEPDEIRSFQG
ncbi:MAG: RNA polymerase sigma factor [Marinilabiliaceae bacterium]|jgi:RNA polymerase sigma-70 factor (ECF subfamily)|nr:RNA polymerase sigma factor [Marinilabiliaceae bacterium]